MTTWYYIIGSYFLLVNLITFAVRGIDKRKAINNKWRTKEKTLLIRSGVGGFLGALMGMTLFHHKTIKGKFLIWFMFIAFLRLIAIIAGLYFLRI